MSLQQLILPLDMTRAIVAICFCLFAGQILADNLKLFTSDGCSAFPDGTIKQNQLWLNCCTAHDYAYWKGGTYQERLDADVLLQNCVSEVGEKGISVLMLAGVRVGGSPYFPTAFRWGYGWSYPKFYAELSPSEREQIKTQQGSNGYE